MKVDAKLRPDFNWNELYHVAVQRVALADSARTTRLYNFLIAVSILILAWSTIFSCARPNCLNRLVLCTLSLAGMAVCLIWLGRSIRGNKYFELQHEFARMIEDPDVDTKPAILWGDWCFGRCLLYGIRPERHYKSEETEHAKCGIPPDKNGRRGKRKMRFWQRWLCCIGSATSMMVIVPLLFCVLFAVLLVCSVVIKL